VGDKPVAEIFFKLAGFFYWYCFRIFFLAEFFLAGFPPPFGSPSCDCIEYSDDVLIVLFPIACSVSPTCPFPWQFYYNCGCCDCVGCLVHVTGPGSTTGPPAAFGSGREYCEYYQMSLHSSISRSSSSQMRTTRVSLPQVDFFLLFYFLKKPSFALLSRGRWRISKTLGPQHQRNLTIT